MGGRVSLEDHNAGEVLALLQEYGISARLTFSNSQLCEEHLSDRKCNELCALFAENTEPENGVIVHSELLLQYLKSHYPQLYLISSTTKVLTDFEALKKEADREDFRYVVPDFRLNKAYEELNTLTESQKDKVEFLCNECCYFGCKDRKECYEAVSRRNLGEESDFSCTSRDFHIDIFQVMNLCTSYLDMLWFIGFVFHDSIPHLLISFIKTDPAYCPDRFLL